jgi:nitrite reductase/ring-hydroxylating ferredoxin subunit
MDFADVGPEEGVPETGGLRVLVDGRAVALFRDRGAIVAFDDACPHAGAPLSEGVCREGQVVCAWHGFRFDARTGACALSSGGPSATVRAVRVEAGRVLVAR